MRYRTAKDDGSTLGRGGGERATHTTARAGAGHRGAAIGTEGDALREALYVAYIVRVRRVEAVRVCV
jgi:hypothetical protein